MRFDLVDVADVTEAPVEVTIFVVEHIADVKRMTFTIWNVFSAHAL